MTVQEKTMLSPLLPDSCFTYIPADGRKAEIIYLKRGEMGYYRTGVFTENAQTARESVNKRNALIGVSRAQEEAMKAGSMWGWNCPAASPENWTNEGILK